MWALIDTIYGWVISEETYPSIEEAEKALANSKYRGDPRFVVAEAAFCSSCGEQAGLIPVTMLDGYGCQRPNCQY